MMTMSTTITTCWTHSLFYCALSLSLLFFLSLSIFLSVCILCVFRVAFKSSVLGPWVFWCNTRMWRPIQFNKYLMTSVLYYDLLNWPIGNRQSDFMILNYRKYGFYSCDTISHVCTKLNSVSDILFLSQMGLDYFSFKN